MLRASLTQRSGVTKKMEKKLTFILYMQNIAGARNVSDGTRLEALYKDVACIIAGEEPTNSKEVVEKTRLPDRC